MCTRPPTRSIVNRATISHKHFSGHLGTKKLFIRFFVFSVNITIHGHPFRRVPSGQLVPGPVRRSGPTGLLRFTFTTTRFLKKKTRTHATAVADPLRCPPAASLLQSGGLPAGRRGLTPSRCCCVPIPRRSLPPVALTHPAPSLPPVTHATRLVEPKPGAASDGGARVAPASTPTTRIVWTSQCCKRIFQVFHADVVKVDGDVAYAAMIVYVCCKYMFIMFHLFFQTYVASVFILMLHMFHTYIASVFIWMLYMFAIVFQVFLHMFQMHVSNVLAVSYVCCNYFIWMFQK
jgi:hypothetical protein